MLTLAQLSELQELMSFATRSERDEIERLLRHEQRATTPTRQKQAEELARCERDIWYWVNNYCWTYDPREADPELPFNLFARQEEFLGWLEERQAQQENGLAEKCRDVGFTWLTAAFAMHRWLFRKGVAIGFGSRKLDLVDKIGDPKCIFDKIRFLLYRLPAWMLRAQAKGFARRLHDGHCKLINPMQGSSITGEGGDNIGRGGRTTIYFVDEAAFLEHPDLVDAALSMNTRIRIDVSTPNGMGNSFYRRRHGGKIAVFTFRWWEDPRKDDAWYKKQEALLDPVIVAQEIDINYAASVEGIVIPAKWVLAAVDLDKLLVGEDGEPVRALGRVVAGMDVSTSGKNKSVFIPRLGPLVLGVETWSGENTTQSAYKAADFARAYHAKTVNYDVMGVGEGVRGTLESSEQALPFRAVPIRGGDAPSDDVWPDERTSKQIFHNRRAELWWKLRVRFQKAWELKEKGVPHPFEEIICIPNHAQLISELSMPIAVKTQVGKIKIESKEDMRKRGVASPDHADALSYTEAGEGGNWEDALDAADERSRAMDAYQSEATTVSW